MTLTSTQTLTADCASSFLAEQRLPQILNEVFLALAFKLGHVRCKTMLSHWVVMVLNGNAPCHLQQCKFPDQDLWAPLKESGAFWIWLRTSLDMQWLATKCIGHDHTSRVDSTCTTFANNRPTLTRKGFGRLTDSPSMGMAWHHVLW